MQACWRRSACWRLVRKFTVFENLAASEKAKGEAARVVAASTAALAVYTGRDADTGGDPSCGLSSSPRAELCGLSSYVHGLFSSCDCKVFTANATGAMDLVRLESVVG